MVYAYSAKDKLLNTKILEAFIIIQNIWCPSLLTTIIIKLILDHIRSRTSLIMIVVSNEGHQVFYIIIKASNMFVFNNLSLAELQVK